MTVLTADEHASWSRGAWLFPDGSHFCVLCGHGVFAHSETGCCGTKGQWWDSERDRIVGNGNGEECGCRG